MPAKIYGATYYYTTTRNKPGEACKLLTHLAQEEVNLLAFHTVPLGPRETTFMIFPLNTSWLADVARKTGFKLAGPHHAFIVHGDDELGALLDIHQLLCDAQINIDNSHGISDGRGGYRYILHVKESDFEEAARILGAELKESHFDNFELKIPRHFEASY